MASPAFSDNLEKVYSEIRKNFALTSRDYNWRVAQLKALKKMLVDHEADFNQALWADLHKSKFECVATEQGIVISEVDHALKYLARWMTPVQVSTPLYNLPGSCEIHADPLGLALIIGAWNYPVNLLLAPMVGALAGGNAVILKPSELAVNTAALISRLIPQYMDKQLIAVIEAGPEETGILLDKKFDTIFFTGSGPVGKIVMTKAAQNLTPVTLELGGKSPAIVLADANVAVAAKRLTWGKFMNAGQTCVAPDYILVHSSVKDQLISEMKKNILEFYGADASQSPDYCRIINQKNFDRLQKLFAGEKILIGGENKREELFIAPTVVETSLDSPLMKDEIFGPILPVIEMSDLNQIVTEINLRPKPLALYLFTQAGSEAEKQIIEKTSAGGVCINDVILHMPVPDFPFGGVGASGMGHYHGQFSFEAFTHSKGVLKKATWVDVPLRYAPYSLKKLKWLRWLF